MRPCRDLRQTGRPSPLVCFADGGDDILCWGMRGGGTQPPRAAAAAVSMMAGAYLDAETSLDERRTGVQRLEADLAKSHAEMAATLTARLLEAGLPSPESAALVSAVKPDPLALKGLLIALQADPEPQSPRTQALWMLFADFFSAAVPIVPFMLLPVA